MRARGGKVAEKRPTHEVVLGVLFVVAIISIGFRYCGHSPTDAELDRMDRAYEDPR